MSVIIENLEKILGVEFKLLDHGFIRVIDYMGGDSSVVQSARVSYGEGTKSINKDRDLIRYLMRCSHTSPFEQCEIKFHVKCPLFVMGQWKRHRTWNFNEYSGRYSVMPDCYYTPALENIGLQSQGNMQGRGNGIESEKADAVCQKIINVSNECYVDYKGLLDDGIAREISRMVLPQNYYTEFYAKVDLHNLMHFVKLRGDSHAQYEIRVYALQILEILKLWVPFCYEAFMEYKFEAKTLSKTAINVVKRMIAGEEVNQENSGLNPREWNEFKMCFCD